MVKMELRYAGASDLGRRQNNEDALHMDADRGIFLVVDGIGGQAAGEKAAEIAIDRVRARLERQTGTTEQRIREAITMANNEILRAARGKPEWQGMACVLTVAVLENGDAVVGHVGDSRLYQVRRGKIDKITHDHSPVGEREDNRELSEDEAMHHPRRNEVFRDVGSDEHAPGDPDFIEVQRIPFYPDSALLLCSDGLSDQVPSAGIRGAVEGHAGDPQAAVRQLIDDANRAGGKDNVTVIVVEGPEFAVAVQEAAAGRPVGRFWSSVAFLVCGMAIAAAGAWFSRSLWEPPPAVIMPRVLAVGPGKDAPFPTIAAALAEARAGDTIEVLPGEYREQVRLKDGVTLRSRVPWDAILVAAPVGGDAAVIAEGVKAARIADFKIRADAQMPLTQGILLKNSQVEVDDMDIWGAAVGVEIQGAASPTLRANAIHDCTREGVLIVGDSKPWISHNDIRRTKGAELAARGGAQPSLVGNVFERGALDLPAETLDAVKQQNVILGAGAGRGGRVPGPRGKG